MDPNTKTMLKAQISQLSSMNVPFKAAMGTSPMPAIGGMPPMPIALDPAFGPYLRALKTHAEEFDKLLKLLDELITKI